MPDTRLSVVIPAFNEERLLERFLIHTQTSLPAQSEMIVVDGGSSDSSYQMAIDFAAKHKNVQVIQSAKGRAVQMNAGAEQAEGRYLLFLHVDTRLPNDFSSEFESWSRREPVWGFSAVKIAGDEAWCALISSSINLRTRITSGASGDQALMVRRDVFVELSGYRLIALMEDIDLSYRLRRQVKPNRLSIRVETSGRRWREKGVVRTILLMWFLRTSFLLGVSPERLARFYDARSNDAKNNKTDQN